MKKEQPIRLVRAQKYTQAKKLYSNGYSSTQISRMMKMSRTWVEMVIAGAIPKRK